MKITTTPVKWNFYSADLYIAKGDYALSRISNQCVITYVVVINDKKALHILCSPL